LCVREKGIAFLHALRAFGHPVCWNRDGVPGQCAMYLCMYTPMTTTLARPTHYIHYAHTFTCTYTHTHTHIYIYIYLCTLFHLYIFLFHFIYFF